MLLQRRMCAQKTAAIGFNGQLDSGGQRCRPSDATAGDVVHESLLCFAPRYATPRTPWPRMAKIVRDSID